MGNGEIKVFVFDLSNTDRPFLVNTFTDGKGFTPHPFGWGFWDSWKEHTSFQAGNIYRFMETRSRPCMVWRKYLVVNFRSLLDECSRNISRRSAPWWAPRYVCYCIWETVFWFPSARPFVSRVGKIALFLMLLFISFGRALRLLTVSILFLFFGARPPILVTLSWQELWKGFS